MLLAFLTAPMGALAATGLLGWAAAALLYWRRRAAVPAAQNSPGLDGNES
jgi:hypothetical protein